MTTKTHLCEYLPHYLDKYLTITLNVTPRTVNSYGTSLMMLLEYVASRLECKLHKIKSRELDFHMVNDFMVDTSEKKSWKPATWNNRLAGVKVFLDFLSMQNPRFLDTYNRVQKIKSQTRDRTDPFYLSKEELDTAFVDYCPRDWVGHRDFMIVKFMVKTGLRAFELRGLRQEDLIRPSSYRIAVRFKGKGRKDRSVPIVDKNFIKDLDNFFSRPNVDTPVCFPSREGVEMSESNLSARVTRFFEPHSLSKKVKPHDLRRTAAMLWLNKGMDILSISALLGHEETSTTEGYVKINPADREAALRRISSGSKKFRIPTYSKEDDETIELLRRRLKVNKHLRPIVR